MNDLSKFGLLGDRILLKVLAKSVTKGGLVLPESVQESSPSLAVKECVVVKVGPGKVGPTGTRIPCMVKVGDTAYVNQGMICNIEIGDTKYGLINEDSILAYKVGE